MDERPPSIWGLSLDGQETNFLATRSKDFELARYAELPTEIRNSLPKTVGDNVLVLTTVQKLVRQPRAEGEPLVSIEEKLCLVADSLDAG